VVMFRGQYEHAIDAKGRTSLPSRYRDALMASGDPRLVITRSLDRKQPCLHVFPMKEWEKIEERIAELPELDPHATMLRRIYVSAAVDCELDKHGRLLIPNSLRDFAGLQKSVVWAGGGKKAELWAKEKWDEALTMTEEQEQAFLRAVAEQLRI